MRNFLTKYYSLIIGIIVFIIYLTTTSPTVTAFDSGELAAVQSTLGIAHPPGYPLFTIIGYLFLRIPLHASPIFQLHILSVIWSTLSVVFFILSAKLLLDNLEKFKSKPSSDKATLDFQLLGNLKESSKYIAVISGGLIFSFCKILWTQSTEVEVYSLQMLIGILIIYFSLKAFSLEKPSEKQISKHWIFVALLFGLGFSNHMMTLYLIPATIYLYFLQNKFSIKSIGFLFLCTLIVITVAVTFYSYLPLRANQNPVMNWGNPIDIKNTYEHVTAKYYSRFFFPGWETIKKQLTFFIASVGFLPGRQDFWSSEFNFSVIFVLTGLAVSLIIRKRLFAYLSLIFFTTLLLSVNYNIPDIYTYFSFSYLSLGFFSVFSIAIVIKFFSSSIIKRFLVVTVLVAVVVYQLVSGYGIVNKSDYYVIEDYTKALTKYVKKDAVIFTNQWGYFFSPAYYVQHVCNYRKDVKIIHKDLLPLSWYMRKEKEKGLIFFNSKTGNVNITEYTASREFYVSPEILRDEIYTGKFKLGAKQFIIPDLLIFRVVNTEEYYPAEDPDFNIRFPEEETLLVKKIKELVFAMLQNRVKYELQYGKKDRAKVYLSKIIELFPQEKVPAELLLN